MYQSKFGFKISASVFYEFPCFAWTSGLAFVPLKGLQSPVSVHQGLVGGSLCLVRFVLFWFLRHYTEMINKCFHIPTCVIYCSKLAGLQALLPSSYPSWYQYPSVFTFLPPYLYCKILFVLYADKIKTDLLVPSHTVRCYRAAKTDFPDNKSGCWLLRWKMMSQSCCWFKLSLLWSPESFLFPFGNNSVCFQFFSPGVSLASRKVVQFFRLAFVDAKGPMQIFS